MKGFKKYIYFLHLYIAGLHLQLLSFLPNHVVEFYKFLYSIYSFGGSDTDTVYLLNRCAVACAKLYQSGNIFNNVF